MREKKIEIELRRDKKSIKLDEEKILKFLNKDMEGCEGEEE